MLVDVIGGRLEAAFSTPGGVVGFIKAGKLRPLAITTLVRLPAFPDLGTIHELGVPGYEYLSWVGFFAPVRVPAAEVTRLNSEMAIVAQQPDIVKRMVADGGLMKGGPPEELGKLVAQESARWNKLVKDASITVDE